LYIIIDPNNRGFLVLDALPKLPQGTDDRVGKLVELVIDCRVCHSDPKPREESVDETVGVA